MSKEYMFYLVLKDTEEVIDSYVSDKEEVAVTYFMYHYPEHGNDTKIIAEEIED